MTVHESTYVPDVAVVDIALDVQSPKRRVVACRLAATFLVVAARFGAVGSA